jgi:hypothetical protein
VLLKAKKFSTFVFAVGVVFSILLLIPVVSAQEGSYNKIIQQGKKAYSLPVSENTVRFQVLLAEGKTGTLMIQEGGMAKIGDLDQGYAFALVPTIKDMGKKIASFTIFALTQDDNGNESIRQLQRLDVGSDAPISVKTNRPLQIKVLSIEPPKSGLVSGPQDAAGSRQGPASMEVAANLTPVKVAGCTGRPRGGSASDADCCVNCGVWACATCVWLDCGCCCDPPYRCYNPN